MWRRNLPRNALLGSPAVEGLRAILSGGYVVEQRLKRDRVVLVRVVLEAETWKVVFKVYADTQAWP